MIDNEKVPPRAPFFEIAETVGFEDRPKILKP